MDNPLSLTVVMIGDCSKKKKKKVNKIALAKEANFQLLSPSGDRQPDIQSSYNNNTEMQSRNNVEHAGLSISALIKTQHAEGT